MYNSAPAATLPATGAGVALFPHSLFVGIGLLVLGLALYVATVALPRLVPAGRRRDLRARARRRFTSRD